MLDVKLDDGKFFLIIVKIVNIFEILYIVVFMLNGGWYVDDLRVIYIKISSLFVEIEDDINWLVMINLDGEYGGEVLMYF